MSNWIDISNQIPSPQEWCLVYAKWANQQVLCWDNINQRWTDFEEHTYHCHMFTHWQPLPEPPQ